MTEQKAKKRGWVKDAAIVFLAVMLVLTFFSNTIMNRSLPEVAAQYVTSGTINTKIRGTGTVTANATYDVTISQTRKVKTVHVRVGDIVKAGDLLFTLEDTESEELKAAQELLDSLNLQYQKALINATESDYARENRDIALARTELEELTAKRDANIVSDREMSQAKQKVESARLNVTVLQAQMESVQAELDALGGLIKPDESLLASLRSQMKEAETKINQAKNAKASAELIYGHKYEALKAEATSRMNANEPNLTNSEKEKRLPIYMDALAQEFENNTTESISYDGKTYIKHDLSVAYAVITKCDEDIADTQSQFEQLQQQYNAAWYGDNSAQYSKLTKKLKDAQDLLTVAKATLTEAEEAMAKLEERRGAYDNYNSQVKAAQKNLEDLLFNLAEQQKADEKARALEALDMAELRKDIAEQQELVDKYMAESVNSTVTANVGGAIKSISVNAGGTATPDQPMAVIELTDRGYSLSFAVTNEQARKVKVGDTAEVLYYWGPDISANLTSITNDPQNPGQGKLLTFTINGEVEPGTTLTLSVGQRSADYELVVPNSAIRTDSNGDFVLVVVAKNTPLGNRYIATRVDVQVLAKDDTNSAVSGGLNPWDFVITTSTKPIEHGMQVRLVDDQI